MIKTVNTYNKQKIKSLFTGICVFFSMVQGGVIFATEDTTKGINAKPYIRKVYATPVVVSNALLKGMTVQSTRSLNYLARRKSLYVLDFIDRTTIPERHFRSLESKPLGNTLATALKTFREQSKPALFSGNSNISNTTFTVGTQWETLQQKEIDCRLTRKENPLSEEEAEAMEGEVAAFAKMAVLDIMTTYTWKGLSEKVDALAKQYIAGYENEPDFPQRLFKLIVLGPISGAAYQLLHTDGWKNGIIAQGFVATKSPTILFPLFIAKESRLSIDYSDTFASHRYQGQAMQWVVASGPTVHMGVGPEANRRLTSVQVYLSDALVEKLRAVDETGETYRAFMDALLVERSYR